MHDHGHEHGHEPSHGHGHEHAGSHGHGDAHGHGPGHAHEHAHGGSSHVHLHAHGHAHGGAHEHGDTAAGGHDASHGHSHAHGGESHEHVHAHAGSHEQAAPEHAHGGPDHSHGGHDHSHGHGGHDHSHDHGSHGAQPAGGGGGCAALAGIVAVVVLALAFASDRQGGSGPGRSSAMTLTLTSGERLEGWSIEDRNAPVIVAHKGEQELLIPREKLREVSRGAAAAPRRAPEPAHAAPGTLPPEGAAASPQGGGVLVLLTGRVIVGRVEQQGQTLVVRWPYKDVTWSGEMRIPLSDVRWYDLRHDRPTADYYRRFPHERIDPGYEQGSEQHQQQELDERALRLEAQAARLSAHWEDAARLWGELEQRWPAADKRRQLVDCACALFREQGGLDPNEALTNLDRLLRPLSGRPEALGDVADCYERLANAALDASQLPLASHMTGRLRALGPMFGARADRLDERGLALQRSLLGELHEGHEHDTPREPQHAVPTPPNGPPEIELPR